MANSNTYWNAYTTSDMCKNWLTAPLAGGSDPDRFMKERVSLIELALRVHDETVMKLVAMSYEQEVRQARLQDARMRARGPADRTYNREGYIEAKYRASVSMFNKSIEEMNERFKQANVPLAFQGGYFQFITDELTEQEIVKPFWKLVTDPLWGNVSTDMSTAIDLRDTGGRDPAWYASKALESVIKIISDTRGWTTGNEKGAANYVDNLVSKNNGRFVDVWESEVLKDYFSKVRNPFGHGAGSKEMPELTDEQTDWAIEACMSWSKSLIERL